MLIRASAQTFSMAALRFQNTPLKYSWIHFLPVANEPCVALSMLPRLIQQCLREVSILNRKKKDLVPGSEAIFIPQTFRTDEGVPLVEITTSLHKSLDENYDVSHMTQLSWLGVATMSHQQFFPS
jgi:hypothetical protein